MQTQVLSNARLNRIYEVRQGNYGPFQKVIISHPQLPKNQKGYNEVQCFPSPDNPVCSLQQGASVDLVIEYKNNKIQYRVQVPQGQNMYPSNQSTAQNFRQVQHKEKVNEVCRIYLEILATMREVMLAQGFDHDQVVKAATSVFISYR